MMVLTGRFEFIWVVVGGMAYVYYLVLRLPKGVPRLLALLPLLPFYVIVPWRAETTTERALQSFFFLWLSAFKLVMLAYDTGPVKDAWTISSFHRFLTVMSFSLHFQPDPLPSKKLSDASRETTDEVEVIKENSFSKNEYGNGLLSRKSGSRGKNGTVSNTKGAPEKKSRVTTWLQNIPYSLDWRVALLRCLFYFIAVGLWLQLYIVDVDMPELVTYMTYTILLYLGILFVFELPAVIASSVFGVRLPPQFNMPFLATSLSDFWGRRWNLLVNNLLRGSIYNPIILGFSRRSGEKPTFQHKAIAILAAFTVSGIMHEIIFFYMSRRKMTFEVTMFFVLNGVATIFEACCRQRKISPPEFLRRILTLSFVFLTASWLFFPPLVRNGSDRQSIIDLDNFIRWVAKSIVDTLRLPFSH